jgi:hypothetical protein
MVHQQEPAWNWLAIADNDAAGRCCWKLGLRSRFGGCVDGDRSAVRCLSR